VGISRTVTDNTIYAFGIFTMKKDERKDLTLDWDSLTISEQSEYYSRASYLINNRYVMDTDIEELAKRIFAQESVRTKFAANGDNLS
jgi:hypothetical protein